MGTTSQVSPELCLYGDLKSCQVGNQDKPAYSTSCSTSTGDNQVTEREELQMVAWVKASSPPESPSSRGCCPHRPVSYQLITALWVSQIMVLQYLQRFLSHTNLPSSVCLIGGCGSFVYLSVCLFIYFKAGSHYVAIFWPRTYYVDKAGLELTGICLLLLLERWG